jgi:hypothetical protein
MDHHQWALSKELFIITNQETSLQLEDNCSEKKLSMAKENQMLKGPQLEKIHLPVKQNDEEPYSVVTPITDISYKVRTCVFATIKIHNFY